MSILKRNKNFFLLWQGQLVSQVGSKIYLIALSWYFVAELRDNQGFVIALLVSSLPFLLFGFGAGPLVEKWNKKWIIFLHDFSLLKPEVNPVFFFILYLPVSGSLIYAWRSGLTGLPADDVRN